jgi:hypothetical protein
MDQAAAADLRPPEKCSSLRATPSERGNNRPATLATFARLCKQRAAANRSAACANASQAALKSCSARTRSRRDLALKLLKHSKRWLFPSGHPIVHIEARLCSRKRSRQPGNRIAPSISAPRKIHTLARSLTISRFRQAQDGLEAGAALDSGVRACPRTGTEPSRGAVPSRDSGYRQDSREQNENYRSRGRIEPARSLSAGLQFRIAFFCQHQAISRMRAPLRPLHHWLPGVRRRIHEWFPTS